MLKKTITYVDYDGNKRTEDFWFHLNKVELTEMNYEHIGGMDKLLETIIKTSDIKGILDIIKDIILRSYGEKSADGKRFIKSKEAREAFEQTEAFVELYMELAGNDGKAAEFINGIVPQDIAEEAAKSNAADLLSPA